uniref:Uncharacterized protein n=1 Tax=Glossina pallidipes TaxID=7398 RepID=A0A1A9ZX73_GLOPL
MHQRCHPIAVEYLWKSKKEKKKRQAKNHSCRYQMTSISAEVYKIPKRCKIEIKRLQHSLAYHAQCRTRPNVQDSFPALQENMGQIENWLRLALKVQIHDTMHHDRHLMHANKKLLIKIISFDVIQGKTSVVH